jgi:RNA recognition motif-containing protein
MITNRCHYTGADSTTDKAAVADCPYPRKLVVMKNNPKVRELFVTEISYAAEEEDLRKLFVLFGTVTSVHMIKDPKSGVFKGCAFVRMSTAAQAKDALNSLDGTYLIDRCITVTAARPKKEETPSAKTKQSRRPRGKRK